MKKLLIVLATGLMIIPNIFSQKISKVDFQQTGSEILISYRLSGLSSGQTATVSVYVSTDGGKTFTGPLTEVRGDVGENVKEGMKKFIQWNALKEMPGFGGNVVFDVRAPQFASVFVPCVWLSLERSGDYVIVNSESPDSQNYKTIFF